MQLQDVRINELALRQRDDNKLATIDDEKIIGMTGPVMLDMALLLLALKNILTKWKTRFFVERTY